MNLIIENDKAQLNLDEFISSFLITEIQNYFLQNLDEYHLIKIEEYLNQQKDLLLYETYKKQQHINLRNILIGSVYNLKWEHLGNGNYIIEIDGNQIVPNLRAKFIDIARLVNFGTLTTPAYPIYTNTFQYIADNIVAYYDKYKKGIM